MKANAWSAAFLEPRKSPLVFLAASYVFGMSINLTAATFEAQSIPWWLVVAGVPIAGVLLIATPLIRKIWPPLRIEFGDTLIKAKPCKGLVVLVSPGKGAATAEAAIRYHASALIKVWLVHSETSKQAALALIDELSGEDGFKADQFEPVPLSDGYFEAPDTVRQTLEERVYGRLPLGMEEGDVIVDFTGGRKTTTAGAFLAGLPRPRRLQVVQPQKTDVRKRGLKAGEPLEVRIEYRLKRY